MDGNLAMHQEDFESYGQYENQSMEELKIYKFQAKQIEDTFRIVANILKSNDRGTSADRDVMQSWQYIKNVLEGKIDESVSRF